MITVGIPNGIMTQAVCPHCSYQLTYSEIEMKWGRQDNHYIRMKCKCKRYIGITQDMRGDFIGYEL